MNRLRIGTYNLLDGGGERLIRQTDLLRSLELDILCLQEAKHWDRNGFERMFVTARALGMQPLFAPSASHGCHLITLYRWPRLHCTAFTPDAAEGQFHHTLSRALLDADGILLGVTHTHLHPFSGLRRLHETGWMTEYGAPDGYELIAADLNSPGPDDPDLEDWQLLPAHLHSRHRLMREDGTYGGIDYRAIQALTTAGFTDPPAHLAVPVPRTAGYWNDNELWDHRSDHILLSPGLTPALTGYDVPDTPDTQALSDHLPVIVTLDLDALLTGQKSG